MASLRIPSRASSGVARIALCALAALLLAGSAGAQTWPAKPVRVVIAFSAGGTTDILGRIVGQQLTDRLKQPFVIDNRPGAGGNLGTELVVRAPADGYTLLIDSVGPIAVNPTLYAKLGYNPLTDLVPIVQLADVPNVLIVHPSVPAKTLEEFVAYARANPGKLNYGSTGVGTSSHLSGYILAQRAGLVVTHVPYKGAEAVRDVIAGRVQFMFATIPSVVQQIASGSVRAIAVSSAKRSRSLPDVPTVAESGYPGFEAGSWFGFFGPKGIPQEVIATVNAIVNEVLATPAIEAQMIREGADPVGGTPEEFGRFIQTETDKWRVVVRESGAKPD
jgi:tripartite-type tricarboxylate transporter receptor subunit TctC